MNGNPHVTAAWLASEFNELKNLSPLASGGQKQVFSATHDTEGDVVLKLMHPTADMERTLREILAVSNVQSSRIPRIFGHGVVDTPIGPCYWFREDRVHGATVRQRLQSGPLTTAELLKLALQVSETLVAAEAVNIVHRDIKPDNLILDQYDDCWVIDFGLARHLGLDSLTETANAFGQVTWGYAPLEQCKNIKQEIDARADLFAFGVTLYECATGVNPFRHNANNVLEVLMRVERGTLPRLNLQFKSAEECADLVATLTQRQRIHRPPSVAETHEWIKEICCKA